MLNWFLIYNTQRDSWRDLPRVVLNGFWLFLGYLSLAMPTLESQVATR